MHLAFVNVDFINKSLSTWDENVPFELANLVQE